MHFIKRHISIIIFYIIVCLAAIIGDNSISTIILGLNLVFFLSLSGQQQLMAICFAFPFGTSLYLNIFGLNFTPILQILFLVKMFLQTKVINQKIISTLLLFVFFSQIPAIIFVNQTFNNLIVFFINLLLFIALLNGVKRDFFHPKPILYSMALGVLFSCVISYVFYREKSYFHQQGLRFCAFWTDPNFLGLFILTPSTILIKDLINNFKSHIINILILIILFYFGFLTLSRTFIIVASLLIAILSLAQLKRISFKSFLIIFTLGFICIQSIDKAEDIFKERQNKVTVDDGSNGRFTATAYLLREVTNYTPTFLFGYGFDNLKGLNQTIELDHFLGSHNSYADIYLQFGFIGILFLIFLLLREKHLLKLISKKILSIWGLPLLIILLYAGTLSLSKYQICYIITALCIGSLIKNQYNTIDKSR